MISRLAAPAAGYRSLFFGFLGLSHLIGSRPPLASPSCALSPLSLSPLRPNPRRYYVMCATTVVVVVARNLEEMRLKF